MSINIYNRWGKNVYKSNNKEENWVCPYTRSSEIELGTYYFVMEYKSKINPSEKSTVSGTIEIKKVRS
jgi:gliding motility-associated-like protein